MTTMPPAFAASPLPQSALSVLVMANHSEHVLAVRKIGETWGQTPRVLWSREIEHAMQLALINRPQLVLIDGSLQDPNDRATEKRIARWCESADVYTLVERGRNRVGAGNAHQLYWDDLPMLLRVWGLLHQNGPAQNSDSLAEGATATSPVFFPSAVSAQSHGASA